MLFFTNLIASCAQHVGVVNGSWLEGRRNDLSKPAASYHAMFVDMRPLKLQAGSCQNCVRYPPKSRSNTVIYGDTPMHIVVVGSR